MTTRNYFRPSLAEFIARPFYAVRPSPAACHHNEEILRIDVDMLPSIHPVKRVVPVPLRERRILNLGEGNTQSASAAKLNYLWALAHQSKNHISKDAAAVYVVGSLRPSCVKVGIAGNPARRLGELQTGNPDFLFLYRVFWVDTFAIAESIEKATHRSLEQRWRRLSGEWFECPVSVGHEEIVRQLDAEQLDYVSLTPCAEGSA